MRTLIGIDLGTTSIKAVLFDLGGRVLAEASNEQCLSHPGRDMVEQDPAAWYEVPCGLVRQLVRDRNLGKRDVAAIGLSSQGISFVPVDAEHRPLMNAISWLDTRASAELDQILHLFPGHILCEMTGKHPSPAYTLPKLLWLKNHRPDVFHSAGMFLMPKDYFLAKTTGRALTDPTMAGGTMLYDLRVRAWSCQIADALGIPVEKLPPIARAEAMCGTLNERSARMMGLSADTPIAVGAQDQKIAAFAANLAPGVATLSLGTAGALSFLGNHQSSVLPTFPYIEGDRMLLEGCINTAGAAIQWARTILFPDSGYDEMNAQAESAPIGSGGVVFRPYLAGVDMLHGADPIYGSFEGLTLHVTRAHLARAVYEGLGCEVRAYVEAARLAGASVEAINAFGGGAKSEVLCSIIAEICGLPLRALHMVEMSALGAAKVAGRMVGVTASDFGLEHDSTNFLPVKASEYNDLYARYRGMANPNSIEI